MPRISVSLCLSLLLSAACFAAEANLIQNGAFARPGADGVPEGWRGSGDPVAVVPADLPDGPASAVRIEVRTQAGGLGEFYQRIAVKPGWNYRVGACLRSETPGLALLQVKLFQQGREIKRFDVGRKSTADWALIEGAFTTPREADAMQLLCRYDRGPLSQGKWLLFAAPSVVELGERVYVPPKPTGIGAVATFESIGVTVDYEGDASPAARCALRYRAKGEAAWRTGLDLVHRPTEKQFRGSILRATPATEYEIECDLSDPQFEGLGTLNTGRAVVRTWSDEVPIARIVRLPARSDEPLVIRDRGTADGWVLYTAAEGGSTIDAGAAADSAVVIRDSAYVIFENITVRGGSRRGIEVVESNHIRVRRCDIAGWGDPGTRSEGVENGRYVDASGKLLDWQAGVHVGGGASQVVVEGNFIHSPRGTANSWAHGHPAGVQGVILAMTNGNNVVRDNDLIGDERHWWNDGIESLFNERIQGGPYRDTDICGNVIAFANDDGTELDGGQINVRFFNNWVQWAFCGVSGAPNMAGPSYVFNNLFVLTGEQRGLTNFGFKMGGDRHANPGRVFLLHNTMVSNNSGLSTGHMGPGASPITARNNAYLSGEVLLQGKIEGNYDLDYDLIQPGALSPPDAPGQQKHAIVGKPLFVNADAGDYRLAAASPGVDAALPLPGVNDRFAGRGPDIGAFEQGAGPLFPVRKSGLSALPLMNRLEVGGDGAGAAAVELVVPAAAGTRWTAHANADWLRCEPATGSTGDRPQRVVLAAVGDLPPREYRGAVTFRTDTGHCRTVLVTLRVRHPQPFATVVEAEAGERLGGFALINDESASGGAYLQVPADHPRSAGGGVRFTFDVPADGTYYVHGRIRVPGPLAMNHDSLFITVDDGPQVPWHLQHLGSPDFHWLAVYTLKSEQAPIAYELKKGRHTLLVEPRETLASIDAICISNEPFVRRRP